MIYVTPKTYGIDTKIHLIQKSLDKLKSVWRDEVHVYGIIQETNRDGNVIPEIYTEEGEYKELFTDDSKTALICFRVLERNQVNASVDIIFNCNLGEIELAPNRYKEILIKEAKKNLIRCGYVTSITGIKEGIKNVYSGFFIDKILNKDLYPFYVFSLTCDIQYHVEL